MRLVLSDDWWYILKSLPVPKPIWLLSGQRVIVNPEPAEEPSQWK